MKPPLRRNFTLLTLALLLAAISTGSLSICDAFLFGEPIDGGTIAVTLKAGETEESITGSEGFSYRFALCPPGSVPFGVYLRFNRDTRDGGIVDVDLVTDTNASPGHYTLTYVESDVFFLGPVLYTGTLDLTILPPDVVAQACFYAYGKGEIILVNQPVMFFTYCSQAPETDPIVQYKWWFNYNNNPNSTPDVTTANTETSHTYSTAGPKSVRLLIRTQSGQEDDAVQNIMVNGL